MFSLQPPPPPLICKFDDYILLIDSETNQAFKGGGAFPYMGLLHV